LTIMADGSTVRGLVIQAFYWGIILPGPGGNIIAGNYIGTDVSGTQAAATSIGLWISSQNNTIGGTEPGAGNLISGIQQGVFLPGNNNVVQGNSIGTDATGSRAFGDAVGVDINGSSDNVIGGTVPGARNLISGNVRYGIIISSPVHVSTSPVHEP